MSLVYFMSFHLSDKNIFIAFSQLTESKIHGSKKLFTEREKTLLYCLLAFKVINEKLN